MNTSGKILGKRLRRELVTKSLSNYRYYPNVIGISYGTKFQKGKAVANDCVQFFVARKIKNESRLKRVLPKYVYARRGNGEIDYGTKLPTDVIVLKELELCNRAGSPIDTGVEKGTATLVFKNKTEATPETFFLTCAHVTGSLEPFTELSVSDALSEGPDLLVGDATGSFFGRIVARTSQEGFRLPYDIAIGVVISSDSPIPNLSIVDSATTISSFAMEGSYPANTTVECRFSVSDTREIEVASHDAIEIASLKYNNQPLTVGNLVPAKGVANPGDSGGIIFKGNRAIGILVARAKDGWVLFQPLNKAVSYLNKHTKFKIKCFA